MTACMVLVVMAAVSLGRSRVQALRQAQATAENLCRVLASDLTASYEKVDMALQGVRDELERQEAAGRADRPALEAFIQRQRDRIPILFDLRVSDAQGLLRSGNGVDPRNGVQVADRDYFIRLKSDPDAGLVFSKPILGRVTGRWALILARSYRRRDGAFGGVVYGALELEELGSHLASLSVGREGTIALRDPDMGLIVRYGGARTPVGQSGVSPEYLAMVKAGKAGGIYLARTAIDGVPRVHAFRRMELSGQYLNVGLGQREALEGWRREFRWTVAVVSAFLLFVLLSALGAIAAMRRQRMAEVERLRLIRDLQRALAEVTTLSGMLPICSQCKKIRDDKGYWNQIETYISSHSAANFTHGLCPDCARDLFPEVFKERARNQG
jgi:hypothetical protein